MKKVTKLLLFVLVSCQLFAQNQLDSLFLLAKNETDPLKKAKIYLEIAYGSGNSDTAGYYIKLAFNTLDKKTFSSIEEKVSAYYNFASSLLRHAYFEKALEIYLKIYRDLEKEKTNDSLLALALHKVGNGYFFVSNFDSASFYYLKALDLREKIGDLDGIAATTNNLGIIYTKLNQYEQAIKFYRISLNTYKKLKDTSSFSTIYNNIGTIFYQIDSLDSAEYYYKKALQLDTLLQNMEGFATRLNNLGAIAKKKKQFRKALRYFFASLKLKDYQYVDDIANLYNNIAYTYLALKQFDSAKVYFDSVAVILRKHNIPIIEKLYYSFVSEYFSELKQYDSAYYYLIKYININDSLSGLELKKQLSELEKKYETQKKEKEIAIQKLTIQKEKTRNRLLTIFSTVFVLMSVILFVLLRKMRSANILLKLQKAEIEQQKEEILTQSEQLKLAFDNIREQKEKIEEQNRIINEVNEQLKSSIVAAQHIQEAMLPFRENYGAYFDTFIIYKPKDIVSGDFYWFSKPIDFKGKTFLFAAVVDCTGHGVPGAFMSMIGLRMFDTLIYDKKIYETNEILEELDKLTKYALKQDITDNQDGMDVCLVRFEPKKDILNVSFSGAKRNLFYYDFNKREILIKKATRRSIGGKKKFSASIPFSKENFEVSYETVFYLTTDGYVDQNNKERKRFGTERFVKLLGQIAEKPLDEQKQILEKELNEWMKDTFQRDDITIIGLKVKKQTLL